MGAVATGAAVVGMGLSAYGAITGAQDQAALDKQKAAVANEQANELQLREQANEQIRDETAYRQKLSFGAAFASSGKEGTGIGSQLEIQRQSNLQNAISKRDADFQSSMLKQQAGIDTTLANETEQSGWINAATSLLGGAGKVAALNAPKSSGDGKKSLSFSGG